jgi:glucose dehydrogenase
LTGCTTSLPEPSSASGNAAPSLPVTTSGVPGHVAAPDDSGDWIRPAKNFSSTRFSALSEITTDTVKQLALFTFSTGRRSGHEAAPLVVNNTMYVVTPWPNVLYALDLTQAGGLF